MTCAHANATSRVYAKGFRDLGGMYYRMTVRAIERSIAK
jgi:hypothetical protein